MEYAVEITETLQRVVYVEADGMCSAVAKVHDMIDTGNIVLGSDDFVDREVKIYKENA